MTQHEESFPRVPFAEIDRRVPIQYSAPHEWGLVAVSHAVHERYNFTPTHERPVAGHDGGYQAQDPPFGIQTNVALLTQTELRRVSYMPSSKTKDGRETPSVVTGHTDAMLTVLVGLDEARDSTHISEIEPVAQSIAAAIETPIHIAALSMIHAQEKTQFARRSSRTAAIGATVLGGVSIASFTAELSSPANMGMTAALGAMMLLYARGDVHTYGATARQHSRSQASSASEYASRVSKDVEELLWKYDTVERFEQLLKETSGEA